MAINAYFWNQPHTGSGQYTRQLVYHLNRYVSDLTVTLIFPQAPGAPEAQDIPPSVNVRSVAVRPGHLGKVYFEQVGFGRACRAVGADLAHVPYWGPPLQAPLPLVVTIHDVTTLLVREYRRGLRARLYNALVSAGARAADRVITDSQASRGDIIHHLGLPADLVVPIYLAAGPQYKPEGDFLLDMAMRQKYDLPEFYILYLGGYEIHKNVTTLLYAYSYVAQALGEDYPLVLAGKKPEAVSERFPDYDSYIERLNIRDEVRWIGFVDEDDKPAVYRQASSFAFLSRHEGFGLPPLEAMACGVPVVVSNSGSLPEVVGEAGFALDPDDGRQIAGSIIATVLQDELAAEMKQKGLAQAERFSWQQTATETVLVYDVLLADGQRS
ncbi:MAG: glycosyltransferase family 1 protein [Candidatus Promineifilaceae bacterium]|nr:glycosyltransferase family 1 protein [Candidatus Promineifilaceae bacterium]